MKKLTAILMAVMMLLTMAATAALAEDGIVRPGDQGEEVTRIQQKLIELEYLEGDATGIYDEATEEAVRKFQRQNGLLVTGEADSVTRRVLETATRHAGDYSGSYWGDDYEEAGAVYESATMAGGMGMMAKSYANGGMYDWPEFSTNEYNHFESNRFLSTLTSPLSTFAADVDTSSYAQLRRRILACRLRDWRNSPYCRG